MQYFETMNAIEELGISNQNNFNELPEHLRECAVAVLASNDMLKQGGDMRDHIEHNQTFIDDCNIEDVTFTLSNVMEESLTFTEEVLHEVLDTYRSMLRTLTGRA